MDLKRLSFILIGVVLVAFGIGFYSLMYIDNFRLTDYIGENAIEITDNGDIVKVGGEGIHILDGDTSVTITWKGIEVIEDGKRTIIGLDGLKLGDGIFGGIDLRDKNIDKRVDGELQSDGLLKITSTFADVSVVKGESDTLSAWLEGSYRGNVDLELELNNIPGGIEVSAVPEGSSISISNSGLKLTVYVPEGFIGSIDIGTSSAAVDIKDLSFEKLDVETSSGSAKVINVDVNKGSVTTSSGSQTVYPVIGDFTLQSSSGSLKLKLVEASGQVSAKASSGSIQVDVEEELPYDIDARTSSGNIDYSGPGSINNSSKDQMRIRIGDGSRALFLETSSGSISITVQ
jgi:hypothetical protein